MSAAEIHHDDAAACRNMRGHGAAIPAPQAHLMPSERQISCRRERAVSPTQHGNAHGSGLFALGKVERGREPGFETEVLDLAHGIARQALDPDKLARNLVAGELRQTEAFDLRHLAAGARPAY